MAANNTNKNNGNDSGFSMDEFKKICAKYKKYIATGVMLVLLAVVISNSNIASKDAKGADGIFAETTGEDENVEAFEVDAYPQVNELMNEYYSYYAAGDVDSIEKIAYPITETEKSYIKMFSKYLDRYEDIKCYTKKGITDGEYIVSVSYNMKYKDIDSGAPQVDRFYVRQDHDGAVYIDNAYSQFNGSRQENTTDENINALLTEFEQSKDVIALQKDIKNEYNDALKKDEELNTLITATMQGAISEWVASFEPQTATDDDPGKTDKDGKDQTEDLQRTAYAKTSVNMRAKRSTESDVIKTLEEGAKVTIYGVSKDGWFKVKSGGDTGFVKKEFIVSDQSEIDSGEDDEPSTNNNVQTRTAYAKTKVNLREKRSTSSDIIKTLKAGTKVTIYGTSKNGWFKVKTGGDTGYVSKEYIVSDKSKVEKSTSSSGSGNTQTRTAYAKTQVNLRTKRSTDSDVIRTLKAGTKVTIYGTSKNGWFKVKAGQDTGYVSKEYIVSDKSKVEKTSSESSNSVKTRTAYAKTQVNLRKKRSTSSDVLRTLKAGAKVTVYGTSKNGWLKVKAGSRTGYVRTEYIVSDKSKVEKEQDTQQASAPSYYNEGDQVTLSESVNVRQAMSESADRVGLAYEGDVVTVIMSYAEGWTRVSWNGQTGYVKTEFLR